MDDDIILYTSAQQMYDVTNPPTRIPRTSPLLVPLQPLAKSNIPPEANIPQAPVIPAPTFLAETGTSEAEDRAITTKPTQLQIGGSHYKKCKIQPAEYIHANRIPFIEGCIIKYVTRWRDKDGLRDLQKAKHFIDMLIEFEELEKTTNG